MLLYLFNSSLLLWFQGGAVVVALYRLGFPNKTSDKISATVSQKHSNTELSPDGKGNARSISHYKKLQLWAISYNFATFFHKIAYNISLSTHRSWRFTQI